jgi:hypothetical protein
MRRHRRKVLNQEQHDKEVQLEAATARGNKAEQQRLVRALARRSKGVAKRRLNALSTHRPDKEEIVTTACLPAGAGGLSARVVDWESEAADWAELTRIEGEPDVLKPMDMNIRTTVDEDLKLLKRSLVLAAKRKGSPSWSVPTELLLLALKPGYTSVSRDTKAGVGATPLDEETAANTSGACLLHLREFLWHLHRCTLVPLVAVRSRAFMIPKKTA